MNNLVKMSPLTAKQYSKTNFRVRQAALDYLSKVRQVVGLQKHLQPIYAVRGRGIVPWGIGLGTFGATIQ